MTGEEVKKAMSGRVPVVCDGIEYRYITAIIYRYDRYGKLIVSAEMVDKNNNSVVIARIENVKEKQNENQT